MRKDRIKNIQRKCQMCGADFLTSRHTIRGSGGNFCGPSCSAKIGHVLSPQFGDKNPNFKGPLAKTNYQHKLSFRSKYPEKAKAHDIFRAAIRSGKILRMPCEICGEKADGHHEDYSKPLDVRWLCDKHHKEAHK